MDEPEKPDYDAISEIEVAATPGPWESDGDVVGWMNGTAPAVAVRYEHQESPGMFSPVCMCAPHRSGPYGVAGTLRPVEDARFIGTARQFVPQLVARARWLESEVVRLSSSK